MTRSRMRTKMTMMNCKRKISSQFLREWQHFAEKMRRELGGKERGKKGKRKGRDRERHMRKKRRGMRNGKLNERRKVERKVEMRDRKLGLGGKCVQL